MNAEIQPTGIANLAAFDRRSQQKIWNWYDWANSAYYTTVLSVLFSPFLSTVAGRAAGCSDAEDICNKTVSVLGIPMSAGSLPLYVTGFATFLSALILPIVGTLVDRSSKKKWHLAGFAWSGAAVASLLFFLKGDNWQLGVICVMISSILAGCSLVSYYAILVDISVEDERDRVSSRGWAFGYLGGGLLLLINLALVQMHDSLGIDKELAVRISLLSAAIWWAVFTIIPVWKLRNYPATKANTEVTAHKSLMGESFGGLWETLKTIKTRYPMTLTFLLAYVFYNDGIQTVLYAASVYGQKQLKFEQSTLIVTILLIQFVAFAGALYFGKLAEKRGAFRIIKIGVILWIVIVLIATILPEKSPIPFYLIAVGIGIVMGGTQALSRSFFSLFIPKGHEGEYFGLYNSVERGTSWFGMIAFGLVFQIFGNYRPAVGLLVVLFLIGLYFLLKLDVKKGIQDAGNELPAVL